MNTATVKILLHGKPMSENKKRVYLRITKNRKSKYISLGLECLESNFINGTFTKKHKNHQTDNEILMRFNTRALEIIRNFRVNELDFSLTQFEDEFRGIKVKDHSVRSFFEEIIEEMVRAGKMGNAKAYVETKKSLLKFSNDSLNFKNIDLTFLEKYEVHLREKGGGNGGISVKMRTIRALFNKAIDRGLIEKNSYPFNKYKISKLKSKTHKTALSIDELRKLKNVDLKERPDLRDTYLYFMFSLYTRGMNFHDMMQLEWSNVQNGRIFYIRSKTKGKIHLEILENVEEILAFYRAQARPTKYVFPILLKENLTPKQIQYRKQKVLHQYNKNLKELALLAGINKNLTSYVARHSFATILKMSGTPIEKISEMMGHADVSITETYLKEFSNEDLDAENRKLLDI